MTRTLVSLTATALIAVAVQAGPGSQTATAPTASQPSFWLEMIDGRTFTGQMEAKTLRFRTTAGPASVAAVGLIALRIGMDCRPALAERIDKLVKQLGDDDYRRRRDAQEKLVAMGPALTDILQPHLKDPDAERSMRIEKILQAYKSWTPPPGRPRFTLDPLARRTAATTSSVTLVGMLQEERLRLVVSGKTMVLPVAQIHRIVRSDGSLDACLVRGRVDGLRTEFVKDAPATLAARYRRVTKTALTSGPVSSRHPAAPWLYPVRGKNEAPRTFVEGGKKYYPIWGTWRAKWRNGWLHRDENGGRIKGPQAATFPHTETKVDYYVVPLTPPAS